VFEFLASHHDAVVSLNLTGVASGTRQAAESAASRVSARERVTVIDTLNASAGQGLVAMYAAECADAGYDAASLARAVRAIVPRTLTFAYLPTLDYGVRGGRVPPIARTLARVLRLSPLLATFPDGRLGIGGVLFGHSRPIEKFARFVGRRVDPTRRYRVIVAHGDAPAAGQALLDALCSRHAAIERGWLVPGGAALGVHGGPGFLVVGLQEYKAPGVPPGG
jgi:DegV family protein with EDD domain